MSPLSGEKRKLPYPIINKDFGCGKVMCKLGDIILVDKYNDREQAISKHSFVIVNDEGGTISGLSYDIVCNVMSSFKNEEQKKKKLSYPGNFPVLYGDSDVPGGNRKDGYIKAEQLYYFDKEKLDFEVIGYLLPEVLERLIKFIEELEIPLVHITDNLS